MASMSHFQTQNCNQYDSFEITSKCFWKKENLVNSLSPAPRAVDATTSTTKKKSQKIALLPLTSKFGPREVNSFSQLCA